MHTDSATSRVEVSLGYDVGWGSNNGYLCESTLTGRLLQLQTALGITSDGVMKHPELFRGLINRPDVVAAGLLAITEVASTSYTEVGPRRTRTHFDPLVTASRDRLRFESFSVCNGVYARFDLLLDGIETGEMGYGTSNVDINPALRAALAAVHRHTPLQMAVGSDELVAAMPKHRWVEREVDVPERWVRGLADVPSAARELREVGELKGVADVGQFLSALPKNATPGPDVHLAPALTGFSRRLEPGNGTFRLAGAGRLAAANHVARFAGRMRAFSADGGASGWVFELPGARLTLLLSAGGNRTFTGECALLNLLMRCTAEDNALQIEPELDWQPVVDVDELSETMQLSASEVDEGLAWLASLCRAGYDLAESSWFHRELPYDVEAILRRSTRLIAAQELVDTGNVVAGGDGWSVIGTDRRWYRVVSDEWGLSCNCGWEREHHGTRGPCKHILAVLLSGPETEPRT